VTQLKADKQVAKELNVSAKDIDRAVQDAAKGLSWPGSSAAVALASALGLRRARTRTVIRNG